MSKKSLFTWMVLAGIFALTGCTKPFSMKVYEFKKQAEIPNNPPFPKDKEAKIYKSVDGPIFLIYKRTGDTGRLYRFKRDDKVSKKVFDNLTQEVAMGFIGDLLIKALPKYQGGSYFKQYTVDVTPFFKKQALMLDLVDKYNQTRINNYFRRDIKQKVAPKVRDFSTLQSLEVWIKKNESKINDRELPAAEKIMDWWNTNSIDKTEVGATEDAQVLLEYWNKIKDTLYPPQEEEQLKKTLSEYVNTRIQ